MALHPLQFNIHRYQASFRQRTFMLAQRPASRLAANVQERSHLTPVQALPGFAVQSHENSKIAVPQTANLGYTHQVQPIEHPCHAWLGQRGSTRLDVPALKHDSPTPSAQA